jgi:hypothetical protein
LGGEVTASGGETVTESGIVYSTTDDTPTIAEGATKVSIGTGTGSFSESVTGLSPGTTYYVNAYATNSVGTSSGTATSFTTSAITATIPPRADGRKPRYEQPDGDAVGNDVRGRNLILLIHVNNAPQV